VECLHFLSTRSASRPVHSSATTHQARFLLAIHRTTTCNSLRRKTKKGEWCIRCSFSRYNMRNSFSSCTGWHLAVVSCQRIKMRRKRMATLMLRLVSPPQQQLSRPLQQRHAQFHRSYRRHSLHRDLHKMTNLTTVVGETFGTPFAACQSVVVASSPLFNLLPLDVSVMLRFRDHTVYLLPYTYLHSLTTWYISHCICGVPLLHLRRIAQTNMRSS